MIRNYGLEKLRLPAFLAFAVLIATAQSQQLPNSGQQLTPLAVTGAGFQTLNPGLLDNPAWLAGQAVTTVVSPDHKTMLVLTSGYNLVNYTSGPNLGSQNNADSSEYVFVYDISGNGQPEQTQVIHLPNTYAGITFNPNGQEFYVSGGVDDNVHIYDIGHGHDKLWSEAAGSPVALGHTASPPVSLGGVGLAVQPEAAGVAVTDDGQKLVVANYYNDSLSLLTMSQGGWIKSAELDLRPGKINPANSGVAGGEYPLWVTIKGNSTAYVSSIRDREIVVVDITGALAVTSRIKVTGQPGKMVLNSSKTTLYAAEDESDSVAIIDTITNHLTQEVAVIAPAGVLPGALAGRTGNNTNSVALTPDQKYLYVTNGNMNDVAVVDLSALNSASPVVGLIPTGWYPNSVAFNKNGKNVYVVNGKSPTRANPLNCKGGIVPSLPAATCSGANEYDLQLIKAGLQFFPTPSVAELSKLTQQVALNNHFLRTESSTDAATCVITSST
jgi:YVTN family beta-propeller protein